METEQKQLEWAKIAFDWTKHLSTLCTGSILLLVTFMEKLRAQPDWKWLVAVALVAFVVATIGTLIFQCIMIAEEGIHGDLPKSVIIAACMIGFGFIIGILAMVIFGVRNSF